MKTLFREVSINHVYAICHYLTAEISKPKASSESLTQPSGWVLIKSKYPDLAPLTHTHTVPAFQKVQLGSYPVKNLTDDLYHDPFAAI